MQRLNQLISDLNVEIFNPVGLNMVWPRTVAFMFVSLILSGMLPDLFSIRPFLA